MSSSVKQPYIYQILSNDNAVDSWLNVRAVMRSIPIVEGRVEGDTPLYVERYLITGIDRVVDGQNVMAVVTQFGGGRVREGQTSHWRSDTLPSQSLFIPPDCPTHWHYSSTADFAVFYLTDPTRGIAERLLPLARSVAGPVLFSDGLVAAAALRICAELQKGYAADERFTEMLSDVMLEQVYRALTTPETLGLSPRHAHYARLQKVLTHIRKHLADDLSIESLAVVAEVSSTHLRRLFSEALGVPVHRYVQAARLEQARKLLGTTRMPLATIAVTSGFSSQSHMTSSFRTVYAATPGEYRRQIRPEGRSPR